MTSPAPKPPEVLIVQWCPECRRKDARRVHYARYASTGEWCPGVPVELTYVLASDSSALHKEEE